MRNYQVLPLKYRPQNLDEIWIQDHIKITLKRAIESNRVAHAYLFAGPRGVGKTTTARILAKSLNCIKGPTIKPCQVCSVCQEITNSSSMDVLEIDGASNRGIDQVRELRENVKYLPTSCPYKVYIIDEIHMLTQEAFNALLKTLEEPPQHVKFIFATTAPQKVPSTIISRCQRFDFRKATVEEIVKRLSWLAEQENIKISEEAMYAIGKRADGAIRDAESMLDQLRVYQTDRIEIKDVEELLGIISTEMFFEYTDILLSGKQSRVFEFIDKVFSTGYDFMEFFTGLLEHFRLMLMLKLNTNKNILSISQKEIKQVEQYTSKFTAEKLLMIMQFIADNEDIIKRTAEAKTLFEILSLNLLGIVSNNSPDYKNTKQSNSSDIETIWQNFIDDLFNKRPRLASLLETTTITVTSPNNYCLTVVQASIKEDIENEKSEIEKHISNYVNQPVTITVICQEKEKPTKQKASVKENIKQTEPVEKTDIKDHSKPEIKKPINTDDIFAKHFPTSKKIK